jgi:hypothetical protein
MRVLVGCALLLVAACKQPDRKEPRSRLAIAVRAVTPGGEPVADVRAWADGRELGVTRGDGRLRAMLAGREGQRVQLTFACPAGHRTLDPRRELALQATRPVTAQREATISLAVRCAPIEHLAALVVRASGANTAGLPVRAQGQTLGQLARDGTAHLLVPVRARQPLRVMLDTSAVPALRPANPTQTFELRDQDRVVLFEQRFSAVTRKLPTRAPLVRRPYRID